MLDHYQLSLLSPLTWESCKALLSHFLLCPLASTDCIRLCSLTFKLSLALNPYIRCIKVALSEAFLVDQMLLISDSSVICCRVTAGSEEAVADIKNRELSKTDGNNDRVSETVDPEKKSKASDLSKNDSSEPLESKGGGNEQKKVDDSNQRDEQKENKGSASESRRESKEGRLPPIREKCDSSSNSCMDDARTLVACLRVPGNESPALSLLIQNKGLGPLSITISAPDLVQLEKKQIELHENKDTEVKVSIRGVESGHFIVLTAGHGNCSLNFTDQFIGRKKVDHSYDTSYFNIFKPTLSTGFLSLAALLIIVVSVFMCTKFGRKYFARKGPKYQKLDTELPTSHGSKLEPGENEGWDDNWGDSWDDEEAPKTPSLPVTPSLSSKGIAARKSNKEGWKD
ncbi:hypothetical protein Salat_0709800 [Sesamum alatum]|uniref:DUF7356 domain-containing protein n=1 Tax=Sesamum alatum TaxID=300844 RepID=A0AAE1YS26_9LAMI|nr:hypothetical protein Salat_0709800 [Sesamum alatum]